ncbi:MAG: hypothetical protein HY263_02135, partial [Chloroflexi bacterium]|nr:hypothetical protein [Chloroflexota bacterium]
MKRRIAASRTVASRTVASLLTAMLVVGACNAVSPVSSALPSAARPTPSAFVTAPVLARIPLAGVQRVAVAGGAVWVIEDIDEIGRLTRIDATTNAVTRLSPAMDYGLDVGDDTLWASSATVVNG